MLVRTRFAPSPTGCMHIGNLRSALYSYLYALKNNGTFILRIEDTDQKRLSEISLSNIEKTLKMFGLNYKEMYIQSERLNLYKEKAEYLVEKGYAYRDDGCIKLKIPENINVTSDDKLRGKLTINTKELYDIILLKSDGFPTYHLASVVDDIDMKITDVFRGEEWISSLPYHSLLYKVFKHKEPNWYHLPLILDVDGSKLSKRNQSLSLDSMMNNMELLPITVLHYLYSLGGHIEDKPTTISNISKMFNPEKLSKSASRFDLNKLRKLNIKYANLNNYPYYGYFKKYISPKPINDELSEEYYEIYKKGILINETYKEIEDVLTGKKEMNYGYPEVIDLTMCKYIYELSSFSTDAEDVSDTLFAKYGVGETHKTLRYLLTGKYIGLPADILLKLVFLDKDLKPLFVERMKELGEC